MKPHKPQHLSQEAADNVFPLSRPETLSDLGRNVSAFGERFWKLQQESIRFAGERFESNMQTLQCLSACRSLPDLFAAQQKWFAETAEAYGAEWSRCTGLMGDSPQDRRGNGHDNGAPHS